MIFVGKYLAGILTPAASLDPTMASCSKTRPEVNGSGHAAGGLGTEGGYVKSTVKFARWFAVSVTGPPPAMHMLFPPASAE